MMLRSTRALSFFPSLRSSFVAGVAVAALTTSLFAHAQATPAQATPDTSAAPAASQTTATPVDATANLSNQPASKTRKAKDEKVVQSKDTKKEDKKYKKDNPLAGMDAKLPDKELYDKAMDSIKHGRFDVARLDLQTLLNTYPDSQFQMRAKLAIADSWYKEGSTASLTQAEQEYRDFIIFYPNQPEAAEAQMRIGDIYFKEMDKPDRDNSKALHAEEEYRLMLQQFPDSPRIPEAAQRLREVQESLASAEAEIGAFYASHQNWPATIARYQTVADIYPLYSHMDDVLVGLGDAYEATARYYRTQATCPGPAGKPCLPEAAKARLVTLYDNQAAAAYRKVVLEHSAAAHVEDARDRLVGMGLPIPTPTPEQAAASAALESSRGQYTLSKRAELLFLHKADTVSAATVGNPPLQDAARTTAPTIVHQTVNDFTAAVNNTAPKAPAQTPAAPAPTEASAAPPTTAAPAPGSTPLAFEDVQHSTTGASGNTAIINPTTTVTPSASSGSGGIGAEIVQPSANSPAPPAQTPTAPPTFPGTSGATPAAQPATPPVNTYTVKVGQPAPVDPNAALAPVEKAPSAPDQINEVAPGSQPAAQTASANGKKPKPAFDKDDESSSKHKKKKGLAKLNPF